MPYFDEPVGRVKIQTTSKKVSAILHNKPSSKRFFIQHAKVLCPCRRISRIFIYGESVTEVCEAERNLRGKSSQLIGQQQSNLSNRSSGVQIPRDICILLSVICTLRGAVG